jgi:Ca2+-binding RTX toxin-like protein
MVAFNLNDLSFILQQIKISEAFTNRTLLDGTPFTGTPEELMRILVPSPHLPWGLRTVDGTLNNIIAGRENFGAADQPFPRLTDPVDRIGTPVTTFDTNGPGPGTGQTATPADYSQTVGNVVDSAPRTISNLISDQSLNNPAAIMAALKHAGVEDMAAALAAIQFARDVYGTSMTSASAAFEALEDALAQAIIDAANNPIDAQLLTANANVNQTRSDLVQANADVVTTRGELATASATVASTAAALATTEANLTSASAALATATTNWLAEIDFAQNTSAEHAARGEFADAALAVLTGQFVVLPSIGPNPIQPTAGNVAFLQGRWLAERSDVVDSLNPTATEIADFTTAELAAWGALQNATTAHVTATTTRDDAISARDDALDAQSLAAQAVDDAVTLVTDLQTQLDEQMTLVADLTEQRPIVQAQLDAEVVSAQEAVSAANLPAILEDLGVSRTGAGSLDIGNLAPDEGISASFNSWMTLFGQFFDHGLDLVEKQATTKVYVPLLEDDPLYVPGGRSNFMVITRTLEDANNITTPFVDQNQTYTSHASHQVFLREYTGLPGAAVATGHLLEGSSGGIATWADVKAQAATLLGIKLNDHNIGNVPLLATDLYGQFERGPNGFAQVMVEVVQDGITKSFRVEGVAGGLDINNLTLADVESSPDYNVAAGAITAFALDNTGHAFLDDIAHTANPFNSNGGNRVGDANDTFGDHFSQPVDAAGNPATPGAGIRDMGNNQVGSGSSFYDNELLDRHFITGDGRGNENIGLTAVHHVFHSEHNRLAEHSKDVAISSGDVAVVNEWLNTSITQADLDIINGLTGTAKEAAIDALNWNGERLFQAARFGTEMQYQHLVFEEFARKVNPAVDLFVFNPTMDINPAIFAEFAHVVYRFGHSMLNETVDRLSLDGQTPDDIGLIDAFLNPIEFDQNGTITADQAAGAIIRGMTRQVGQEIDEFIVEALRNNLLGLPLDLGTVNLARGRETGIPSLNVARAQFYEETRSEWLKPYVSWIDFAENLKNPMSVVNFIAAYGTHANILAETTYEGKRDEAIKLVLGDSSLTDPGEIAAWEAERAEFLNSAAATSGVNDIDLWIGGLAESILPFGGMLGSTFTFVFEKQMEILQNGDRFYYLSRTQGLHFIQELENNAFSKIIMANTDLGDAGSTAIAGEVFSTAQMILESDINRQQDYNGTLSGKDPVSGDSVLGAMEATVVRNQHLTIDGNTYDTSLTFTGGEHVVIAGTEGNDVLMGDLGDDTIWGKGGDDYIKGDHGVNRLHGGQGDDIIYGGGDAEFIHGDEGNDVIAAGNGLGDLIFAGSGNDFVLMGEDAKETFAGEGNDFVLGTRDTDVLLGGEGDDWLEGGEGFDTLAGDNSELFFNSSIIGHDVMFAGTNESDFDAESGDDIMVQGESVMRSEGMLGFDWVSYEEHASFGADMDMNQVFAPVTGSTQLDILRNRFDRVEAASGSRFDDLMVGDSRIAAVPGEVANPNVLPNEAALLGDELTREGAQRITGLGELLGFTQAQLNAMPSSQVVFAAGNILIGGAGSDTLQGNAGNDRIDGDKWLNVSIGIKNAAGELIGFAEKMQSPVHFYTAAEVAANGPGYAVTTDARQLAAEGQPLDGLMFNRTIPAGNLMIIREIVDSGDTAANDIAVFRGNRREYEIVKNGDGTLTVTHLTPATPAEDDGTDIVSNVEILRFANGDVDPANITNSAATGSLALSIANGPNPLFNQADRLETGDVITVAIGTFQDPDGLPAFDGAGIVWQSALLNEDGSIERWNDLIDPATDQPFTGLTFTVNDQTAGAPVRAIWNYADNEGNIGIANSPPTANVLGPDGRLPITNEDLLVPVNEDNTIIITRAQLLTSVTNADPVDEAVDFINLAIRTREGDPVQGTIVTTLNATGLFVSALFTPTLDFNGAITIDFEVADAGGNVVPSEFLIDVLPVNDAPVPVLPNTFAETPAGANAPVEFTVADILASQPLVDSNNRPIDVDGDRLSIDPATVSLANPAQGTLTFDPATDAFTFVANDGFTGLVSLNYELADGSTLANGDPDPLGVVAATATINVRDFDPVLPAGGFVLNDTTPVNGQLLTANFAAITDANNIVAASRTYQWEVSADGGANWAPIAGAVNPNFTPDTSFFNQQLRVVYRYTDEGGSAESVTSAPSAPVFVNFPPVGAPTMSDVSPTQGVALSASALGLITDPNGDPTSFQYRWEVSANGTTGWTAVDGGAGTFAAGNVNFTPGAAQAGQFLRVVTRFTDGGGTTETVASLTSERVVGINVGAITGIGGASIINGNAGDDVLAGGGGNDTVNGNAGSDIITWGVTNPIGFIAPNGLSDGRDLVNGGIEPVTGIGDTFVINGNNQAEVYRIYSNMDDLNSLLAGLQTSAAAAGLTGLNTATEIVITRNTNGVGGAVTNANIIAELADIEEIIVNTGAGADTVLPVGNFTPTNLAFNTITINAGSGDDIVDVSGLGSEHHVVLNTGGGADTLVGQRAQDELNVQTVAPDAVVNLTETYHNMMQIRESSIYNGSFSGSRNLLDDNDATFMATANGANEWIELDLGGSFDVTTIAIKNRDIAGYRLDGAVVTLLDATGAVVHTFDPITGAEDAEAIELSVPGSVNAHAVHITGAANQFIQIAGINVFGSGTPDVVGGVNLTDVYHNYVRVNESSLANPDFDGNNIADNEDLTFAATSNGSNEWIEMNLGGNFDISCLILKNRDAAGYRLDGAVVSLHDAQGAEVYAFDPIRSAENGESFRFMLPSGVNAHFVRIVGAPNEYLQVAELDVFGSGTPDQAPLFTLGGSNGFALTASDISGLHNLISGQPEAEGESEVPLGVRDLSGFDSGMPDTNFIRLTDAHYGPNGAINPLFADIDARAISNILGAQELDLGKNAAGSNIFFMAFGQYFDHGLDFLAKGGSGKIIIDGIDAYGPMGEPANFADLTRGTQTGLDENGDPLHTNKTSVFVDQNQAYGSHKLVGEFLRESDEANGFGPRLFTGAPDLSAPGFHLLPTLGELISHHVVNATVFSNGMTLLQRYPNLLTLDGEIDRSVAKELATDFMDSGQNLLIDANRGISVLDHFIAGDGRVNENISLTAMHTVWARNHNFHVENLEAAGFTGTPTEIYEAAKMLNEAEYQRVVFTEFADHLIGGIQGVGDHGFKEHNPDADPRISHEFAAAVYRVGHSLISDTLTVLDADGQPTEVRLVDAFLNPASYASHGVGNILGGTVGQQAEEVDFNIVDAVRNDLVGTRADLFAFNVARGWDVGLGTLNQVRAGLMSSDDPYVMEAVGYAGNNLSPYTSWEDFQRRNGLSDAVISQFEAAYPDLVLADEDIAEFERINPEIELVGGNTVKGIDRVDLWVGGLAEQHINGGQVGQTFWVVLHEQFDRLQEADEFYYIDRFDNFDLYEGEFEATSFAGIVARNTGLTNLPEDIFSAVPTEAGDEGEAEVARALVLEEGSEETAGGGVSEDNDGGNDSDGGEALVADGDIAASSSLVGVNLAGDAEDNMLIGAGSDDTLMGNGGDDGLIGGDGADMLSGGAGDDMINAGGGDDVILAGADNDYIFAGEGDDVIQDGAGADYVFGGDGDDTIIASLDNAVDNYYGGGIGSDTSANDTLDMRAITQSIEANMRMGHVVTGGTYNVMEGIENIMTGSGNDVITASAKVNHMNGGLGNDVFVFNGAGDANLDVIDGFEAGDKIDLSNFMGNSGTISLVNREPSAQGELGYTFKEIDGEEYTVLRGNIDADAAEEFTILIKGHHNLNSSNIA